VEGAGIMKAVIEIDLEIDGDWRDSDKKTLLQMISKNPHHGIWEIDEDRCVVLAQSMTVEITE
jgi:hypothetical protein